MTGAAFNTGSSKQDYATPKEFIAQVENAFGKLQWDLAAHEDNSVLPYGHYYGPGSRFGGDSLAMPWGKVMSEWKPGLPAWLNPPFGNITPWAKKCAEECRQGAEILFLVPASVGSNWFWDHVAPYAHVYAVSPRLSFDGKHPFPKDLILAHYRPQRGVAPVGSSFGFSRWKWK